MIKMIIRVWKNIFLWIGQISLDCGLELFFFFSFFFYLAFAVWGKGYSVVFRLLSVLTLNSSQTLMVHHSFPLPLFSLAGLRGWDLTIHTRCLDKAEFQVIIGSHPRWPHCFFSSWMCPCWSQVCSASCPIALVPMWQLPAYTFSSVCFGSKPVG